VSTPTVQQPVMLVETPTVQQDIHTIVSLWPIFLGFITLVIVLAKMHSSIEVLREKVHTLFELFNQNKK